MRRYLRQNFDTNPSFDIVPELVTGDPALSCLQRPRSGRRSIKRPIFPPHTPLAAPASHRATGPLTSNPIPPSSLPRLLVAQILPDTTPPRAACGRLRRGRVARAQRGPRSQVQCADVQRGKKEAAALTSKGHHCTALRWFFLILSFLLSVSVCACQTERLRRLRVRCLRPKSTSMMRRPLSSPRAPSERAESTSRSGSGKRALLHLL